MSTYLSGDRRLRLRLNGELVSVLRRDMGLTQVELAHRARLARSTVAAIEQTGIDGHPVHRRTWKQIAKALGRKRESDQLELLVFEEYIEFDSEDGHHKDPVTLFDQYAREMEEMGL